MCDWASKTPHKKSDRQKKLTFVFVWVSSFCFHTVPQAFRIAQGMEFFITTGGLLACGGLRRIESSSECKLIHVR